MPHYSLIVITYQSDMGALSRPLSIPNLECITIRYMLHAFPSKQSCYGAQYARRIVLFYEGHGGEIVGLYERRSCLPFVLCIPYCPYVGVQFSTDEEKINFALTYLSGVAQDWFEVALQ